MTSTSVTSVRVARVLNAVASMVLVVGAGWQAVLAVTGHGWWRMAVAVGAVWLAHHAVRVVRYGPRVRG
ncbi:MAG TPA: hypothetical protein VIS06_01160 [Mycobacteriales bacterium]